MADYKPRYLVMVTASANNNKYYKQVPNGDDTWTAEYGRVGSSPQRRTYSMSQWESKYREKIRKGYVDQSELVEDLIEVHKPKKDKQYKDIENQAIAEIVEKLQSMARKAISDNYTISSNKVTQAMVDEAQDIITGLIDKKTVEEFNDDLLKLFTTIPRQMEYVSYHVAQSADDFPKIIDREQNLLDVMRGQIVQHQEEEETTVEPGEEPQQTILEALGLEFEECDNNDVALIKSLMNESQDKFRRAWRVKNNRTQGRFDKFVSDNNIANKKLLFHGSRNENWFSIIKTGLVLRPTNAIINGKYLGNGIYFAPKCQKSIGYTSLSGSYWAHGGDNKAYMALFEVAYGSPYNVYKYDNRFSGMDYNRLQSVSPGANCLHAHARDGFLRNDEIVFYKEDQLTIKYLIEIAN